MSQPFDDVPPPETDREVLSWAQFGDATRALAQQIVDSEWTADVVVAIARGGLIPAGAVAYALGVKAMASTNVEFYTGIAEVLTEPVFLPPLMDVNSLAGKKVLVVDDVTDSGRTLEKVLRQLRDVHGNHAVAEARSAVLYHKPWAVLEPEYVWRNTARWITFPWSALPPVEPAD